MLTKDITDEELIMMVREESEDASNELLRRYSNIIDILISKYSSIFYKLDIDKQEVYAEALVGFTDALNNYEQEKDASFPTFLTLCMKRRIGKVLRKHNTEKSKFNKTVYSLDYVHETIGMPLIEIVSTDKKEDPLYKITEEESFDETNNLIKENLSSFEIEVYEFMVDGLNYNEISILLDKNPKQIDNAIQRIKLKIKEILENYKD